MTFTDVSSHIPNQLSQGIVSALKNCFRAHAYNIRFRKTHTVLMVFDVVTVQHYTDAIMTTMASQITSLTVVYSTVYSDANQRKHQSSASLAFVWGIHRDRWIPRTKGQLRGECLHLMTSSWVYVKISINSTHLQLNQCLCGIVTGTFRWCHMGVIVSQITGNSIVCWTTSSCQQHRWSQSSALLALCDENPLVACGFLAKKASNAESVSITMTS